MHLAVEDVVRWGWHVGGVRTAMWHDDAIAVYERQARLEVVQAPHEARDEEAQGPQAEDREDVRHGLSRSDPLFAPAPMKIPARGPNWREAHVQIRQMR